MLGDVAAHFEIRLVLFWRPGTEAVHVAVVHTKGCCDQDCIMDFFVGGAVLAGQPDIFGSYVLATLLNVVGDVQQRFQFVRNFRFNESLIHMLQNVESVSKPLRSSGEESMDMVVPAMKVREFNFTETTKF